MVTRASTAAGVPMHAGGPHARCGAHCRQTGQPCKNRPVTGGARCRMHGGRSLSGPAAANWRGGRYSQALGGPLRARYEAALANADRLSLADDVSLAEARVDELLTGLQADGGATLTAMVEATRQAREHYRAMREANARGDGAAVASAASALGRVLEADLGTLATRANAQERQWQQVFAAQQHKRRLVQTEHKRALTLAQVLTLEQAHALFARLSELVSTHVSNPLERRAIADGLVSLVGRADGGPAAGGGGGA